ncbi:hypothetical protein ARHIZOSPH14_16750 [Agromyces rhizosphaerae]|uniref:Mucin-associated surface protein n=1 Tax=Agromyces rhizosphaerae TaxID=88374 RepID=A0A9W6CS16_9MICO|nr:hypothetical protein [Agromyces rhizosphaerae]GLI27433.1 hypothetical protein ARHIZOSPH14_16750 [Agromyces rhizosphaerae]
MTRTRARGVLALVATAAVAWSLAGCAAGPDLDTATGETLQAGVAEVAQRSDEGDLAGAMAALDLLEEELAAASDDGRIDDDREAEVREAIALVRTDLESALADEQAAEEAAAAAAAEAAAEEAAETSADTGGDQASDDNSGPGNNNGNGNGNSGRGNNNGNGNGD